MTAIFESKTRAGEQVDDGARRLNFVPRCGFGDRRGRCNQRDVGTIRVELADVDAGPSIDARLACDRYHRGGALDGAARSIEGGNKISL